MKARILTLSGLSLAVAVVLGLVGFNAPAQNSPPPTNAATAQAAEADVAVSTNVDDTLANANGSVISTPDVSGTNVSTNPRLGDFVKLVQAGVGDTVILAYVNNSSAPFNLSSDDILYLNDLGASDAVVAAMLAQDKKYGVTGGSPAVTTPTPAAVANVPTTPAPAPAPDATASAYAPADANAMAQTPPLTPSVEVEAEVQQAPNVSYGYFYDSLSPYGSWVNIEGYGPCWQPTVVVANPGWQPYCDRGRWAYTDSGWCWVSDYSWGWAPFHYGRWFHNTRFGWCWAPDTVWGPAWVSWRYSDAYCGWAPLPPSACFRPGVGFSYYGRSVGFNFGFGIGVNNFTFVSINHFNDRAPGRYRVEHREVTKIYNTTVVHNQIIQGNNNRIINRGIPVDRVSAATHTDIKPIRIQANTSSPRSAQLDRTGRSLSVYRPELPTPKPGNNSRFVGEGVQPAPNFNLHSRVERQQPARTPVVGTPSLGRPNNGLPNGTRLPDNGGLNNRPTPNNRNPQPGAGNPNSINQRGANPPDRQVPDRQVPNRQVPDRQLPAREVNPAPAMPNNPPRGQAGQPNSAQPPVRGIENRQVVTPPFTPVTPRNQGNQQEQQQLQRNVPTQPIPSTPRQDIPIRSFDAPALKTPSGNAPTINPGFRAEPPVRSEPSGTPRMQETRPAPEMRQSQPQFSPPVRDQRPDNGGGVQRGNGNGNGGNGNGNNNGFGNGNGNGNGRGGRGQ